MGLTWFTSGNGISCVLCCCRSIAWVSAQGGREDRAFASCRVRRFGRWQSPAEMYERAAATWMAYSLTIASKLRTPGRYDLT